MGITVLDCCSARATLGSPLAKEISVKDRHEVDAINHFIAFLKMTRGVDYVITDENVVVPANGTNYDYQLTARGGVPQLAVEMFRLVESEDEIASERHRDALWKAIKTEFLKAGLTHLLVHTPFRSPVGPRDATRFAKELAQSAVKEIRARPNAKKIRLEGGFYLQHIAGLDTVACASNSDARWIDSVGIATPPLLKSLAKKDRQLAVSGIERIALCANWAPSVDGEDAVEAVALLDTSRLVNIDKVYFASAKAHQLVYARGVRDAIIGQASPALDGEEKTLLESSLTTRLDKGVAGAFEVGSARPVPGTAAGWSATHRPARKGTGRLPEHALYDLRSPASRPSSATTRGPGWTRPAPPSCTPCPRAPASTPCPRTEGSEWRRPARRPSSGQRPSLRSRAPRACLRRNSATNSTLDGAESVG